MPAPLPPTPSERIQRTPDGNENKRSWGRYLGWALFLAVALFLAITLRMWTRDIMWAAERGQAMKHCRQTLDDQILAWNSGNLEGFMAGYWNDEELTFCSGGTVTKGWQATIDRYHKRYQADGKEMGKLQFDDVQFKVMSGEAVVVSGRWKLALSDSNPEGLFTLILRPFKDGWKIVYDHTSIAEPPKKS